MLDLTDGDELESEITEPREQPVELGLVPKSTVEDGVNPNFHRRVERVEHPARDDAP